MWRYVTLVDRKWLHFLNQSVWMSEIVCNLCDSAVFCALHDQLASLGRYAQLTRCFSTVAELLVKQPLGIFWWNFAVMFSVHIDIQKLNIVFPRSYFFGAPWTTNTNTQRAGGFRGRPIESRKYDSERRNVFLNIFYVCCKYGVNKVSCTHMEIRSEPDIALYVPYGLTGIVVLDRIAWILVWLAAFAGFLYIFIIKIQQLRSYPTNIDINFNFVNSLPFPAVTVCNLNPYRSVSCFRWRRKLFQSGGQVECRLLLVWPCIEVTSLNGQQDWVQGQHVRGQGQGHWSSRPKS